MAAVPDAIFDDPRLAELYDPLDGDRDDLSVYEAMVAELGAHSILDLGCGTGTLACRLAMCGHDLVGVDPAAASLDVARRKVGADLVRWIHGDATTLPPLEVDLVLMTGNVAQVFVTDAEWAATLDGVRSVLRPEGRLVFETRDPAREAWREWNREASSAQLVIDGVGLVTTWVEVTRVELPLVSFRWSFVIGETGDVLVSDSTLRFREQHEILVSLDAAGLAVLDVRDAPDRPGAEWVFVAEIR